MPSRSARRARASSAVRSGTAARVPCLLVAALLVLVPFAIDAQYFGRNKVLWERFEFEILDTEHFRIHYYPPDAPHADYVARLSERWYARLADFFDHEFDEKKPIIIYLDHADFQQTVVTSGLIGESTGGFTESVLDRVVLPLTGVNADNDHVIGHELVHAFQFDIARRLQRANNRAGLRQLPLWVVEGLAEYLSQGRVDPTTALWMRDAVLHDGLPDLDRLIQRQPSPYHYGQAIWAYVAGRWDDVTARRLFVRAISTGLDSAFQETLGMPRRAFFDDFHAALRSAYGPVLEGRNAGGAVADRLLHADTTGGAVNLAPSLSPDGRWIAFLSTRELQLELYLANAETGELQRRLIGAEVDRHIQNLSFLDSSVAWSPDGRRFAFSAFVRGERRLAIYDVERGRVERRIEVPDVKGMRHAAWVPDGGSIVFSAIEAGASDLYMLELATGELKRLTDDGYTAIQPAVSPDGGRIAFVTDRGSGTDLDRLGFGPLQIALLDIATGKVEVLPLFERGKHIDPHFSSDGVSLFFIAEPDGIQDVFRYDFADGRLIRMTAMKTGVSGITDTSPALSVAANDTLAFSVLEDGGYNIYRQRSPQGAPVARSHPFTAAILPPDVSDDAPDIVERYLTDLVRGLPPGGAYPTRDYEPRVRLTDIGPAAIGAVNFGRGASFAGAISAYFNDPLNRHQVMATLQGGSAGGTLDFEDTIGADVTYLNQTRRFQWGGRVSRVPYITSATFLSRRTVDVDGMPMRADVQERLIAAEQVSELAWVGRYPLSLNDRFEAAAGIARIDFEYELERIVFPDNARAFRETIGLPSPDALDLRQGSVAYVRDTSTFGFASPVRGARFRLENQWTGGDLTFRTTRVDYRRYFFRRPLTFAFRVLHFGRHGGDADDPRLPLLDVGSSSLVRGYDVDSFDLSECTTTADVTACPEFDRLIGSRIAVVNFELRVPLLGTADFGIFEAPAAPTEAIFFIDAGAAWSSGQSVELSFARNTAERVPVVSAGIAARTVLLGALPIEFYYAVPFQRPQENAVFGFRIGVGW
jgi:Tol biopolymer transport system component